MHPTVKAARVAGAIYLFLVVTGVFVVMYVPRILFVPGNASATANNILASELLFRVFIVVELISTVTFIFLVRALYHLLSGVNKAHASLMAVLVYVSATIGFVEVVNHVAALALLRGAEYFAVFDKPQREALAMLLLGLDGQVLVNQVFWGLWLFPFGMLVTRSGFLPRILGIWLLVNGAAYVVLSFIALLLPEYSQLAFNAAMPALLGELAIMLWLLIKGAKVQPLAVPAS